MAQFIQIYSQFIQNGGTQELLKILWALCTECHPPGIIVTLLLFRNTVDMHFAAKKNR